MYILGISAFYHDSAACIIRDGNIIAAAQEERFTRKKHDPSVPINAIKYCLRECDINISDVEVITYYENSTKKFSRILKTYIGSVPKGSKHFIEAMRVWLHKKLFIKKIIYKELNKLSPKSKLPEFDFYDHHLSHASASFYPSPFNEAVILCMDGVGEWATTSAWIGRNDSIIPLWEIKFPHSLGLLYSAFTSFCGFKANSGEYKLMGLAPYGKPIYANLIKENLIDIKSDGTFRLNLEYFTFHHSFKMTNFKFSDLFGIKEREFESEMKDIYLDIAASIQKVTDEIVLLLTKSLAKQTKIKNLCLSGGVALNCVSNGKIIDQKVFDEVWIQPAAGDAGSALGAAYLSYFSKFKKTRLLNKEDSMKGTYLGPSYSQDQIESFLNVSNLKYIKLEKNVLFNKIADYLDSGNVIGLFNGRMEFGPRALGNRSIIGDARNKNMQTKMNLKIKFRESFRPFAPAILEEDCGEYFELNTPSKYMLLVSQIKEKYRISILDNKNTGLDKLREIRSELPAITHVDYSARIQTVSKASNEFFYSIIKSFKNKTNCPVIINTSFNIRGEPIVNTLEDAVRCFMKTNMDILILENFLLIKSQQENSKDYDYEVELD